MNEQLQSNLEKFKITTINIIEALYRENYDDLQMLFEARQMIIDKINLLIFDKSEFSTIGNKLNLNELEAELNRVMIEKKMHLKNEMAKLNQNKNADNNYKRRYGVKAVFFNREG